MNKKLSTKFYHYSQNNSGGSFNFDEDNGITHHVIVEADNHTHANRLAENIGLYFDGAGDCECCGNRWYPIWDNEDGTDAPMVYGKPVESFVSTFGWMPPGKEIVVHYLNGSKEWFGVKNK